MLLRLLWITLPAARCSSRRFRGTYGLPINKKNSRPNTGTKKISNSQAMAEPGRRCSGTSPRATRLIAMMRTVTRSVVDHRTDPLRVFLVSMGLRLSLGRW